MHITMLFQLLKTEQIKEARTASVRASFVHSHSTQAFSAVHAAVRVRVRSFLWLWPLFVRPAHQNIVSGRFDCSAFVVRYLPYDPLFCNAVKTLCCIAL